VITISITAADLVKYPFLPQARKYVAQLGLDFETIASLPKIRERAKQRVSKAFEREVEISEKPSSQFDIEIASYPLAILYVAGIADAKLTQRFALFESQQINAYLELEKNRDIILEIAKTFEWNIQVNADSSFSIHFPQFLQNTSRGRLYHDPKWKLVNRLMNKGWIRVTPSELARLLQEEVQKRIEQSADQELTHIPEEIQKDIEEVKAEFAKRKPLFEEIDQVIRAQESDYPPCIKGLMDRAEKGQHLSHVERFTLVTYLVHQDVSIDTIVNLFSNVSDFKEDKTRYQVENLAGLRGATSKPYVTYNCDTLQTHGVCSNPTDPICRRIKNPLTYHLRKQGRTKPTKR
jgi:DNA primase large subunit